MAVERLLGPYDVRRTRYNPVAVTEMKEGSVSSTGSRTVHYL